MEPSANYYGCQNSAHRFCGQYKALLLDPVGWDGAGSIPRETAFHPESQRLETWSNLLKLYNKLR
jgi:hypothetical protein